MKAVHMILNDGDGAYGRVLKPATVEQLAQNGLGEMKIKAFPGVIPSLSNDAEFFPEMSKSWGSTYDQRRAGADRPIDGRIRLGGAHQPLLLDRPQERP
jgi:hypothetical protein